MPKHDHPPAFQFYVDDFIADSAVDAMTNEELGIYVRLLCKAWKESPVGTIPTDDKVLANWAKSTPRAWAKCKLGVLRAFVMHEDGHRYVQKRMQREWQRLLENRQARSQSGSKGAANRWQTDGKAIANPMAKNGTSSSSSFSTSVSGSTSTDDDDDGAREIITSEEASQIFSKAARLRQVVDCRNEGDGPLVLKVAMLWRSGDLSDDDVEQVLESFSRKRGVKNGGAWLHSCLSDRCKKRGHNFEQMLAMTDVPAQLLEASP